MQLKLSAKRSAIVTVVGYFSSSCSPLFGSQPPACKCSTPTVNEIHELGINMHCMRSRFSSNLFASKNIASVTGECLDKRSFTQELQRETVRGTYSKISSKFLKQVRYGVVANISRSQHQLRDQYRGAQGSIPCTGVSFFAFVPFVLAQCPNCFNVFESGAVRCSDSTSFAHCTRGDSSDSAS